MIVNYTGEVIIVNTSNKLVDYSDINNFLPNDKSIILGDGQQSEFIPKKNIYIMTESCKYSGHFPLILFRGLPKDPIIYVGIKRDEVVWFSKDELFSSDVDFGLVKLIDQSSPWMMIFNPYYIIMISIILVIILLSIVVASYFISQKIIVYFSA